MTTSIDLIEPVLTFRLGDQIYALLIDEVVEVAVMVALVKVVGESAGLLGIVNRHGSPLPLLDLRQIFEQAASPPTANTLFIVVQHQGQAAGLVVDEVLQVEYRDTAGLMPAQGRYISGIISQGERLIQMISLEAVLKTYLPEEG